MDFGEPPPRGEARWRTAVCSACRRSRKGRAEPATKQNYRDRYEDLTGRSLRQCPQCRQGLTWWLSVSSRGVRPNLRQSWIPHDPQRRFRTHRRTNHWSSGTSGEVRTFRTGFVRSVSPSRLIIPRTADPNHISNGPCAPRSPPMHLRCPPLPRRADHSKPIDRTVVERFSPTRL